MQKDLEWLEAPYLSETEAGNLLSEVDGLHPLIARLLVQRGHRSFDEVSTFFNPEIEQIANFGEMLNLPKATNRLIQAVESSEKILLYGDYDVDGTCSVSMMFLFLKSIGANVSFYIPDRYSEGYGVSTKGVDHAIAEKVNLLITLDCGITGNVELERATAAGMDVIICDHHLPGAISPAVFAILNPQQAACTFDGKELCGCGVGLMLLRNVCIDMGYGNQWMEYLDLAAIATCCDIVPLVGINRIIVAHGMKQMQAGLRFGIKALVGELKYGQIDTVSDVVFKIGPRINAAGRLAHAKEAVELMISEDAQMAKSQALKINDYNTQRKSLDADATQEALIQVKQKVGVDLLKSTVVYGEDWNKGIIGIVASRLIENFYRPTIVLTESNGNLTGSARSVNDFNIYNAIAECAEHLEQFGGHAAAAGLTLKKENLEAFEMAFEKSVSKSITEKSQKPRIHIDAFVALSDWYTDQFGKFNAQMNRFRPFGPFNMPLTFATENVKAKDVKIVAQDHLKFTVYKPGDDRRAVPVIAFKMATLAESLEAGTIFNLAYSIEQNEWKGRVTTQLNAKAIQLVD